MQALISTQSEGMGRLKNPTKNNMALNAVLYNDLNVRTEAVGSFLRKNDKYKTDACYAKLLEQNRQLGATMEEIETYSYAYEGKKFKQKTGYEFSTEGSVLDFVSSTFGHGSPSKGVLYAVNNVRVLQSVPGGVLFVMDTSGTYMVDSGVGFLATNKKYADGSFIHGVYAAYTGLKSYNTVLGANKQVYAFKVVNTDAFAKQLSSFYFYPQIKEITAGEVMPKLLAEI